MTAAITLTAISTIEHAVLLLAKRCDGAHEQDGAGYNRYDADWGRRTAAEIEAGRHPDPLRALRVVSKYRKQLTGAGVELPDLEAVAEEAKTLPAASAPQSVGGSTERLQPKGVEITKLENGWFAIHNTYPYHTDKARALPGRKWAKELAGMPWTIPASSLAAALEAFPGVLMSADVCEMVNTQRALVEEERQKAIANEARRSAEVAAAIARYELILTTLERRPFEHQDSGIRWLIESLFAILADDMGLGKTFQALVAARALNHKIIVVAPAGLRVNWLREAQAVDARIEVYSWAKLPQAPRVPFTLIADEAHYAQNMKAQRTKKFLELAAEAKAVFALTGTPIKNGRPANLFALLAAIKHPLAKDRRGFEKRYCNAGPTRFSKWDVTGAAHLEELHEKIADGLMRRMKEECLDLPGKMRVVRDIRDDLSMESRARFDTALNEMQAQYQERKAKGEIQEADALVMLNHVRHASSLAKVEAAIEMAEEIVEQGGQVVVFTAFLDSADEIARKLRAGRITGNENAQQRQNAIDAFQQGVTKAIVCTLAAGGVGVTLTAAQTVILVDRPWTPGDALQAEDRLYRIGQKGSVLALWIEANESDVGLDALLDSKWKRSEIVITGQAPELGLVGDFARFSAVKSIKDLAAKLFGGGE